MDALFRNILYIFGLRRPSPPSATPEENCRKYKSLTQYSDIHHPYKDMGYVSTYKAKNYHYHFDQMITLN